MFHRPRSAAWLLAAAAPGLTQCDRQPPASAPAPEAGLSAPAPIAALDRADMIAALARAASDYAGGAPVQESLEGRRFAVRLPFGCPGDPVAQDLPGVPVWSRADDLSVTLRLAPADWMASPPVAAADAGQAWANADGVWISRPWLAGDACPPPPPALLPAGLTDGEATEEDARARETADLPASSSTASSEPAPGRPSDAGRQTAGLLIYSRAEDTRIGRRQGQPYLHLIRGRADQPAAPPASGWRLVLEGRIGAFPDGRSIRCSAPDRDARPVCVAAVQVDRVAFDEGDTRRTLAEWRPAG